MQGPQGPDSVDVRVLSDEDAAEERALKDLLFGFRQAGLAMIDHLERYMRARQWLKGPLTSDYRRRGKEQERRPTS